MLLSRDPWRPIDMENFDFFRRGGIHTAPNHVPMLGKKSTFNSDITVYCLYFNRVSTELICELIF